MQESEYTRYNVKKPHFSEEMDGKPPLKKLRELRYDLPEEFTCFPSVSLDDASTFWAIRGGNDLLDPYITLIPLSFFRIEVGLFLRRKRRDTEQIKR